MKINLLDEPLEKYRDGVTKATTRDELIAHLREYKLMAFDAFKAATRIEKWEEFKTGLDKERQKEYAGDEWAEKYAAILIPNVMMQVNLVATEFAVPWGLAFYRLMDAGAIKIKSGVAIWVGYPDPE